MSRKALFVFLMVLVLVLVVAAPALAAPNPSGTGQPNQSCEAQPNAPAGFSSGGFTQHATQVYAGSGAPSVNNAQGNAVSQYDVACFQVSQH